MKIRFTVSIISVNKWINKCPAIIFATNRTERVIGRIKFLTNSIKTKNGAKKKGLPSGTRWAKNLWYLVNENNTFENHKAKAKGKTKEIWADGQKKNGNKDDRFNTIIERNRGRMIKFAIFLPVNTLNSFANNIINLKLIFLNLKTIKFKMTTNNKNLIHLRENLKLEGSNEENKFIIM